MATSGTAVSLSNARKTYRIGELECADEIEHLESVLITAEFTVDEDSVS